MGRSKLGLEQVWVVTSSGRSKLGKREGKLVVGRKRGRTGEWGRVGVQIGRWGRKIVGQESLDAEPFETLIDRGFHLAWSRNRYKFVVGRS